MFSPSTFYLHSLTPKSAIYKNPIYLPWTLKHVDALPNPDPNPDLFVFIGRWSKQKGVDLIAGVMPSL